jgi:hypothetical protein
MVLLGDEAQVEAHFGVFGDSSNLDAREIHSFLSMYHRLKIDLERVLIFVQDWCMCCAERNIGSEIIFDAPDELLGDMGHLESHFSLFRDSVSVSAR